MCTPSCAPGSFPSSSRPSSTPRRRAQRWTGCAVSSSRGARMWSPAATGRRPTPSWARPIGGAERRRLPILAICRGIQILNVALGGTLYQDLTSERPGPVDHADTRSRHGLRIEPGTLLHRTLGAVDAKVNTRHHQAIRDIAPALRATAWAEDGVIEGAEWKDPGAPRVLAVQWHPEDDVE